MASSAAIRKDEDEQAFTTGENFADLFENSVGAGLTEGSVVKGTVVALEKDLVVIDVGLKSEGRIPLREFGVAGSTPEVHVGDQYDIYIERFENREGEAGLSREKALREESWIKLELLHKAGTKVDGTIFGRVKGGFTVDIQGAVAFLPGSQVDIRPIKDITPLMGVVQPFIILKMDRRRGNIVVSRRSVLEESRAETRTQLLDKISEGQILDGIVKNITDYGAFIDMGGVDGLLHVTDISWKRINHPSEVFSIGDNVRVIVTKYDADTKRISLGMKQLESNPWDVVKSKFEVGARLKGKITNITDYGAFVELDAGIEGLVHVSEMSWTKKNVHPSKLVTGGQEVDVQVLDVDTAKHRISLGMKQCIDNPWQAFAASHHEGDLIEGEVRNITDFGLFVGISGDIDGLVHHSDISWTAAGEEAIKAFKKGDKVKARILLVDIAKERISLGIKQLTESPVTESMAQFKKNETVTCKVTAVEKDGIEVEVSEGVRSFIKRAELSRDRQDQRPERFAVGDRVDAQIVSSDKKTGKVQLSIKALELADHKRAIEEFGSSDSGASLGDILGAALEEATTGGKKKAKKSKKAVDEDEEV
ncbi:MAG: 30S ribosomal protein S1 [Alphaproteobacteria bacterium]|nr:30S ribosomal protein S1 [Rickettsiales bacterium]